MASSTPRASPMSCAGAGTRRGRACRLLRGAPLFVVPLGLEGWVRSKGVSRAMELDWWGSHPVHAPAGDVEVMLLPSQHWSSRGLHDRMLTLWGGFAVMAPDCHLFYAGDTG